MKNNFDEFEEYKNYYIQQIENLINDNVVDISFQYFEKFPKIWRMYNSKSIEMMLFDDGEKYLLVNFRQNKSDCFLCSTHYAIIDVIQQKVICTFDANDEG